VEIPFKTRLFVGIAAFVTTRIISSPRAIPSSTKVGKFRAVSRECGYAARQTNTVGLDPTRDLSIRIGSGVRANGKLGSRFKFRATDDISARLGTQGAIMSKKSNRQSNLQKHQSRTAHGGHNDSSIADRLQSLMAAARRNQSKH
jgi:hypothetical protein